MAAEMTKLVPAVTVPTVSIPRAVEAPTDIRDNIIMELAVTAVVATVAVPLASVTVPNELAPAAVPDPTLVLTILLPAVPKTKLPLVAVMAPEVAVIEPGATNELGTLRVTVDPEAAVVISLAVPAILILPADGVAVPVSPVS